MGETKPRNKRLIEFPSAYKFSLSTALAMTMVTLTSHPDCRLLRPVRPGRLWRLPHLRLRPHTLFLAMAWVGWLLCRLLLQVLTWLG